MNGQCFCVTIACMLVASHGCRCGTVNNDDAGESSSSSPSASSSSSAHNNSVELSTSSRLDAIKLDILGKLGMTHEPNMDAARRRIGSHPNASMEEKRNIIRMYRKSLRQLRGETHDVLEEEKNSRQAKQFHSYSPVFNDRVAFKFKDKQGASHVYFQLDLAESTNSNKETHVVRATLRLHVRERRKRKVQRHRHRQAAEKDDRGKERRVNINVYQVLTAPSSLNRTRRTRFTKRLVDSRVLLWGGRDRGGTPTVGEGGERWEEFNITRCVQEWARDPGSNHGLLIVAGTGIGLYRRASSIFDMPRTDSLERRKLSRDTTLRQASRKILRNERRNRTQTETGQNASTSSRTPTSLRSNLTDTRTRSTLYPSLIVYTRRRSVLSRPKRFDEKLDCAAGDGETRCCRYPLWVSFKDIGWSSWILAPVGYQAYYCAGSCPHRFKVAHRHADIKSLVNAIDPASSPAPCCSATKLSSMSLAHYNADGHAVISVFEDMIVDECKCA